MVALKKSANRLVRKPLNLVQEPQAPAARARPLKRVPALPVAFKRRERSAGPKHPPNRDQLHRPRRSVGCRYRQYLERGVHRRESRRQVRRDDSCQRFPALSIRRLADQGREDRTGTAGLRLSGNNIVNLSERETIGRKRLADLSDELTLAETDSITAQNSDHQAASSATLQQFPEVLKSEAVRRLEQQLSQAKSELAGFSSKYGSEWPAVKETRLEIQDLEKQLTDEKRRALAGSRQGYEMAQDRHSRLDQAVDDQRAMVDDLNDSSIQYNILQREVDSNKELYEGLLLRLKEAGVAAGLRSSNMRIADTAKVPGETLNSPSWPHPDVGLNPRSICRHGHGVPGGGSGQHIEDQR